jgi:hypothetical protein
MMRITRITLIMMLPLLLLQFAIGEMSQNLRSLPKSIDDCCSTEGMNNYNNMMPIRRLRATPATRYETARELRMIVTMEEFDRLLQLKNHKKRGHNKQVVQSK